MERDGIFMGCDWFLWDVIDFYGMWLNFMGCDGILWDVTGYYLMQKTILLN